MSDQELVDEIVRPARQGGFSPELPEALPVVPQNFLRQLRHLANGLPPPAGARQRHDEFWRILLEAFDPRRRLEKQTSPSNLLKYVGQVLDLTVQQDVIAFGHCIESLQIRGMEFSYESNGKQRPV